MPHANISWSNADHIFSVMSISAWLVDFFSWKHIGVYATICVSPGSCRASLLWTSFSISLLRLDVSVTGW